MRWEILRVWIGGPKVDDLGHHPLPTRINQNILRLEIAVQDFVVPEKDQSVQEPKQQVPNLI